MIPHHALSKKIKDTRSKILSIKVLKPNKHCQSALIKDITNIFRMTEKLTYCLKHCHFIYRTCMCIHVVTIPSKTYFYTRYHWLFGEVFFVNKQINMVFKLQHAWRLLCCVWNVHCFQQNLDLLKS